MQWLGDHEVGDEVDRRLSKIKESETPGTTSSVPYGASFPYEGKPYFRVRCSAEKGYPARIGAYYLQNLQGGIR